MTEAEQWAAYANKIAEQNKDVISSSEAVADMLPGIGDARSLMRAQEAYQQGNYGDAAMEVGTTALGYVPLVGPLAKAGARYAPDAIGAARAIGAGDMDFLRGWGDVGRTAGVGADVVKGGTEAANEARKAHMAAVRKQLKEESGDDYDVMFHSSPMKHLDQDNFKYRPVNIKGKGSYGQGPGIFTHGYDQDYDKVFGDNVYAVVYDKRKPTYSGKMDDVSGIDETFIPQGQVGEMVRVWGGGKPVKFNNGGPLSAHYYYR